MRYLLTCLGELLIDFLPLEERGRTIGFTMHPGGSPLNVAVGLARLAAGPVAFAGKVATDFFGRFLRAYVESQGIDTRFLLSADASSTLAFVAMESGEAAYSFYGEGAADTLLTAAEVPSALFDETRALHIGSISLLRGTTPAAVLATVERLKGKALISFDPNIRPSLVRDEPAYRALLARLFALADVVKISAADLAWLAPGSPFTRAAELLAQGPALVVVTRGGEGIVALRAANPPEPPYDVPAFPVAVVDTVGAGDTFDAGLLAGLAERGALSRSALLALDPNEIIGALRYAAAAAALVCARAGADPPRRAEVEQLLARHTA
jgi:fructokinase